MCAYRHLHHLSRKLLHTLPSFENRLKMWARRRQWTSAFGLCIYFQQLWVCNTNLPFCQRAYATKTATTTTMTTMTTSVADHSLFHTDWLWLCSILKTFSGWLAVPYIARWIMCQQLIIWIFPGISSRNSSGSNKSMCLDFAVALICRTLLFEIYLIFYLIQFSRFWNILPQHTYTSLIYPLWHSFTTTFFICYFSF